MSKVELSPLPGEDAKRAEQVGLRTIPEADVFLKAMYAPDFRIKDLFATVDGIPWTGRIEVIGDDTTVYEFIDGEWQRGQ